MHKYNVDTVVDFLAKKSGFIEGNGWLLDLARKGFAGVAESSLVEDPADKFDDNGNYIPNKYDALFFNATFKDTHDVTDLYTSQQIQEEEEVIYCEENFTSLQFSEIEQSMGVGLALIASSIRDIYEEISSASSVGISDFSVSKIEHKLGGLREMDFIIKPSAARKDEVSSVKVHRSIVNNILDSVMENTDSVLILGGDGGSASKRKRGYAIDCVYWTKKALESAKNNRKRMGGRGVDYLYVKGFFDSIEVNKYKAVMINFNCKSSVLDIIENKYMGTKTLVFGMICDPQLALDKTIIDFPTDIQLQKYVDNLRDTTDPVAPGLCYKVLAVSPSSVAVYTDHGIFVDERWYERKNFASFNRVDVMTKMSLKGTYDGIYHGSVKIMSNSTLFINSLSFRVLEDNYDSFIDSLVEFTVSGNRIYDHNGALYLAYTNLPDSRISAYRYSKDGKLKFFDIDIAGSYWFRRYVLTQSNLCLDVGEGLMLDCMRDYGSLPSYQTITYEEMVSLGMRCQDIDTTNVQFVENFNFKMPTMFMRGFYYNPIFKKWILDPSYVVPYIVVSGSTPVDGGMDMELCSSGLEMEGILFSEPTPIRLTDEVSVKKVYDRHKDLNYVRIYNHECVKVPLGYFCIENSKDEKSGFDPMSSSCFADDDPGYEPGVVYNDVFFDDSTISDVFNE